MNNKKISSIIIISLVLTSFFLPLVGRADDSANFSLNIQPPTKWHSLMELANYLVNILVWLSFAGLTIAILYAGLMFVTSGGNSTKVKKAKDALLYTLLGLLIILFSKFIIAIIKGVFSG